MNSSILALRALTAVFFQRIFKPIMFIGAAILVLLWILVIYLGGWVDPWWFLLFFILMPLTLVATALSAALWFLSNKLLPRKLAKQEREQLLTVTDKVIRVAEVRATPPPLMAFLIAKDVIRGRKSSYLEGIIVDTSSLRTDIASIRTMFEKKTLS